MRRSLVVALLGALVMTGLQVQPASAASRPSKVGLVSFVKAGYDRGSNKATLSLDWPDAKRAKKYEIFVSKKYSMSKAKVYKSKSSKITLTKLTRGYDYFVQVRGVNGKKHGSKSTRVGHAAIVRPGPLSGGLRLRIMSYNVCSDVCDTSGTTRYNWATDRQIGAFERIAAASPDILATQEAGKLQTPVGYSEAISFSAKKLFYKTSRFDVAPAPQPVPTEPVPTQPSPSTPPVPTQPVLPPPPLVDKSGCKLTTGLDQPTGRIYLGRHSKGCRYAVWAELVEKGTGRSFFMVNVHTVSGETKEATESRRQEMETLVQTVKLANSKRLPVVYAGDFNSHKNSRSDVVKSIMNRGKFYDAYDLARRLTNQHLNSYNDFKVSPRIGYQWGNHIDKVWIDPWRGRVDAWANIALLDAKGRMVKPIPSDHSPVVVDARIG